MDAKTDDKGPGKCPVIHGAGDGTTNRDWWPKQLRVDLLNQHSSKSDPLGKAFNYREEFKKLDYQALKSDLRQLMTEFAGLVAGGFRTLRSAVHPHGLALGRHLPCRRRAWRRRSRPAALCPAQQLAGQCQPGQGAPPAVADQAEIRSAHFLGRPPDSHRQCGAGDDGLPHLRICRGTRGHMGAGPGRVLGPRNHLARRRRALFPGFGRRRQAGR